MTSGVSERCWRIYFVAEINALASRRFLSERRLLRDHYHNVIRILRTPRPFPMFPARLTARPRPPWRPSDPLKHLDRLANLRRFAGPPASSRKTVLRRARRPLRARPGRLTTRSRAWKGWDS
jgi:hypothetical protein